MTSVAADRRPSIAPNSECLRRGRRRVRLLIALLFVTAVQQTVVALIYPPFQGHDELAHYAYVRTIAESGRLPTLEDNLPADLTSYSRFALDWPAMYEALQPPAYYLLVWPIYEVAGHSNLTQLYALRLASIPLFLVTICLCFLMTSALFPDDDFMVITVPALIAFQPQLSFEGAIVDNDVLATLLGVLLLYLCLVVVRRGLSLERAYVLGLTCGLCLLTKLTLAALLPVVAGTIFWACWPRPWTDFKEVRFWVDRLWRALALVIPAGLLPLPWYLFLHHTYGDFTGLRALDLLEAGWDVPDGSYVGLLLSGDFHLERLREAWGYYGWKLLPLTSQQLHAVYLALIVSGIGLMVAAVRALRSAVHREPGHGTPFEPTRIAAMAILVAAPVLLYGAMIFYGVRGGITQARYVFPAAPALAILATLGLRELVPTRWRMPAAALTIASALAFHILILSQIMLPYALHQRGGL